MNIKNLLLGIFGLAVLIIGSLFFINKNGDYQTFVVSQTDFIEISEISGKVIPAQEIDLSFELTGKVSKINVDTGDIVSEGDILIELDNSEVSGELNEVLANLETEKAKLFEVSGDSVDQNKLQNTSEILISTLKKAYITSDDIVKNTVDTFFDDPSAKNPEFISALSNFFLRKEIEGERVLVGNLLKEWESRISGLTVNTLSNEDVSYVISGLNKIETFLSKITSNVDDFKSNTDVSQTQIDSYISGISTSRNTIASLTVEVKNISDDLREVQADLPVLQSSINNAQASVQKISSRKNKYILRAPFGGIITEQDIEIGKVFSADKIVLSMISDAPYEVEGFIPELNISRIDVGDAAYLTFDAFGNDIVIDAEVTHVDPRETIKDGITTYRALFLLKDTNSELRSGMTTDIKIEKDFIPNVIVLPRYLISSDEEGDYVQVLEGKDKNKTYIKTGRIDGKGGVVVTEGLRVGDEVIISK